MTPKVIDLSHHNMVADLHGAYAMGIRGIVHKATEGRSVKDSKMSARHFLAKQANLLWGVYHFLRPGSMQTQADWFVKMTRGVMDDNTLIAADHEDAGVSLASLKEFMERCEQALGRSMVLYSGNVLKEQLRGKADQFLVDRRLWLAQYASQPQLPLGWNDYWLWQYTDAGAVDGITGPVDLNQYEGSDFDLIATWSGKEAVAPELTIRVIVPKGVRVVVEQVE